MEYVISALSFSLKCIALGNKQHRGQGKDPCRRGGGVSGAMQGRGVLSLTEGWESAVGW
jgi:hypothetical protein